MHASSAEFGPNEPMTVLPLPKGRPLWQDRRLGARHGTNGRRVAAGIPVSELDKADGGLPNHAAKKG